MFIVQALAALVLAESFPTSLHVTHSTCHSQIAMTRENQSGALEWKGASTLVVTVFAADMPNMVIAERAPRAEVSGNDLKLCYNYEPPNPNTPSGVSTPCASPALLEFTVNNLPSASYKPFITPCWPAG